MRYLNKIKNKFISIIAYLFLLFIPFFSFAEEQNYTETKTDFSDQPVSGPNALSDYVVQVFTWGSRIIELIAILMIVYAGYRYITSTGNPEQAQKAKNIIITAIASLLLVILAKLILRTINPNINVPIV